CVRGQPPSALPNNVLYIAGEESAQQIKIRADRVVKGANLAILNETDVDAICGVLENIKPSLVIVDSIQTMETSDLTGVAGSVGQVRECAHRLQKIAKRLHIPIFLVGHVTKDGSIAGPKTLEHLVDVVLSLEGDPASNFRVLRAQKNRFGPVDEVGIFEMEESGMVEVKNPSRLFLQERVDAPGSAITATVSGIRPILVEVQALVTKTFLPMPRRTGLGVDNNKLQVLVAVLMKRLGLPLFDKDIFVSVTGGLRVFEPAADLAICMAIISSLKDKPISPKTLLIGEVGLLGELRPVRGLDRRVKEAKKLGFTKIISPENAKSLHEAVKLSLK
ncbi:MAG: repair protein radA protein, partial [Candidatus Azambacteria bacterium GW2011_GWA1_44_9]